MDTADLRTLLTGGPFASVHFDETHDTEDAGQQLRLHLKEITAALNEQDADRPTVDAVLHAAETGQPPVGRAGRSLVAARGTVLLDQRLAAPPPAGETRYSALPYFLPALTHAEDATTHLVVLVDRTGADIETHRPDGSVETETVRGRDHPVHKVRGGGAGHRDVQSRAEETAHRNLAEVADRVSKAAERLHPRVIVLAGEVQARTELHDRLPAPVRPHTAEVDTGSRAPGAGRAELDRAIRELLAGQYLAELDDLAERFRAEAAREPGLAVAGLPAVTAALVEANVTTLLVGDPGDARVYTGAEPGQIGVHRSRLRALGADDPVEHRADEALPYAAVAAGADVVVMDERLDLADGFGALLRHS
ncbi:peptide subunit release factor 1 (eRF1) [Amycolatopsis sulphurea]|uniref:Peptide subunit release factor 1 (ERF1) n=1 Tax=Amycolatopsis sulphurea TaxID=76022 RepID=A0A2A9G351_9PSEU|nr:Vms1/Ankzf1 family peptidyl-tRNA hydrolase [Amycolatopsis sulphurea]PFG57282.1 peptide subunit release factor 1 (eRF1) [Amycolatopsis sulphurea]